MHVLGHNTKWDFKGIAHPISQGFVVEASTGSITPASFDRSSRCPDEVVHRVRFSAAYKDPKWTGRLLETYDTRTDRFVIAPCVWTIRQSHIAFTRQNLSDAEILESCSTSPSAENPNFVDNLRRKWDYLIRHPEWSDTFSKVRIFQRATDGNWYRSTMNE